ncbi:MAG: hypothetical protein R2712_09110 [Vicinamibacterales bacterium]
MLRLHYTIGYERYTISRGDDGLALSVDVDFTDRNARAQPAMAVARNDRLHAGVVLGQRQELPLR